MSGQTDQKNRMASPEMDPTAYRNLVYKKYSTLNHFIKKWILNKWCWENK